MAESEKAVPELGAWVVKGLKSEDERLIAVEVSPPAKETRSRPPLDVVLAVDRSSSMVGSRIAAAIEAVRQISLRLDERDRLGVVAFDAVVQVIRRPGPVTSEVAAKIVLDLTALGVGYGTNLSGGWKSATELLARGGVPGASKTVLMLTDGLPSRGLRSENELVAMVNEGTEQGIVTSAVGIGDRFDEKLLARMAVTGGGAFRFAERDEDTIEVADEEVEGLTGLAAEDAILHLGFGKSVNHYEVLHELKCRPDGDGVAIELGRLYAGRPRNVLIHVNANGDPRHLGAVGLSCVASDKSSIEVGPVRILMPAPGQEDADMERVGASLVPLLVARWQQRIWERGRDSSFRRLKEVITSSLAELKGIPEGFLTSEEAKEAVSRFNEACARLETIMRDTKASGEDRRRNTEVALKGLTEESTHTVLGVTRVGPFTGGPRGWGKK